MKGLGHVQHYVAAKWKCFRYSQCYSTHDKILGFAFLSVLFTISTAWAGTPIYIASISDPSVSFQIRPDGEANQGARLKVVSNCPPPTLDCSWSLLPNGMIISDNNQTLAWNASGGAREGAEITLVNNCEPTNTDCAWAVRDDGLIVSKANPQLAVKVEGGAKDLAPLKLVSNCTSDLDGCKWVILTWPGAPIQISPISNPSASLQVKADGEANHGARLKVISNCPSGNTDCLWTLLSNGMIISNSDPTLAWIASGGAREGADVTLVRNCQPTNTDCTWTVRNDGLIVSNRNSQLAVKAEGGANDLASLKLAPNCTARVDGCKWVTLPSLDALAGEWVLNHNGYWSTLTITPDPNNPEKFAGLIHMTSRRAPDTRILKGTVTSGAQKGPITSGAQVKFWRTLLNGSVQRFDGFLMYKASSNVALPTRMAGTIFTQRADKPEQFDETAGWFACKKEYCNP